MLLTNVPVFKENSFFPLPTISSVLRVKNLAKKPPDVCFNCKKFCLCPYLNTPRPGNTVVNRSSGMPGSLLTSTIKTGMT